MNIFSAMKLSHEPDRELFFVDLLENERIIRGPDT